MNFGGGMAYDSESGGMGAYGTHGKTSGAAASAGGKIGFYSGSMSGETEIYSFGLFGISIGHVTDDKGNWGLIFGYAPGIPGEATISQNQTDFRSFRDMFLMFKGIFRDISSGINPCE